MPRLTDIEIDSEDEFDIDIPVLELKGSEVIPAQKNSDELSKDESDKDHKALKINMDNPILTHNEISLPDDKIKKE